MERSAWSGKRLDDFAATATGEQRLVRSEMHEEFRALRADISAWQRQAAQIGWALVVALIGAVVAIVVSVV